MLYLWIPFNNIFSPIKILKYFLQLYVSKKKKLVQIVKDTSVNVTVYCT